MKNLQLNDVSELNDSEMSNYSGGETGWYAIGWACGNVLRFVWGAIENPPQLPSAAVYK